MTQAAVLKQKFKYVDKRMMNEKKSLKKGEFTQHLLCDYIENDIFIQRRSVSPNKRERERERERMKLDMAHNELVAGVVENIKLKFKFYSSYEC